MYQYDAIDQRIVDQRVIQFRDQTRRHLEGKTAEAWLSLALCPDTLKGGPVEPRFVTIWRPVQACLQDHLHE